MTSMSCAAFRRSLHSSPHRARIYSTILDTVGSTPIVKTSRIAPDNVNLYVKCEYFNPLSSVKDRLALAMIEHAERTGQLQPGMTVVESTSGNTGIALAMVCAQKGYGFVATMAETFSVERRKIMRALGAKVVLTPAADRGRGMVMKAQELAKAHGWVATRQFESEANAAFHAKTTGPEILQDFSRVGLDFWVTGYGTGGTFTGAGSTIKAASPNTKIILAEPSNAPLVSSGVKQQRSTDGSPAATHPAWQPHVVQGWTPDFIPLVCQEGLDMSLADATVTITKEESFAATLNLASREGIFTGISGGATVATALKVIAEGEVKAGANILCMLPDTMERYMSTALFEGVEADMNAEEREISASTAGFQLK